MHNVSKLILGIESSCDETALAIVDDSGDILCQKLFSQIALHSPHGGVVPEIAARSHAGIIHKLFYELIDEYESNIGYFDIDLLKAIAVTAGPGLIGGIIVGVMFAKGLAAVLQKPCIPINHLAGHALTPRITENCIHFPYLLLLISGGHCQILIVHNPIKYEVLGRTRDDSVGETFDKVAKMLGLGYPGGPIIEKYAVHGNSNAIILPKPLIKNHDSCEFSFSGLKTAIYRHIDDAKFYETFCEQYIKDMCASFQRTVAEILANRTNNAIKIANNKTDYQISAIVASGGVSANCYIRNALEETAKCKGMNFFAPPIPLCTDNAVMIAWAAHEIIKFNPKILTNASLSFTPRSRWDLEHLESTNIIS